MSRPTPSAPAIGAAPSRRALLSEAAALSVVLAASPSAALTAPAIVGARRLRPTPAQTDGPFYPTRLPDDADADLLRYEGRPAPEGTPALVSGRALDTAGRPLAGAIVEVWQCDARGHYHHVGGAGAPDGGPRERDANFQGFGRVVADAQGGYAFRTIRPVAYPGRAPHVHFRVTAAGRRPLLTQLYAAGDPANARDFVLQGVRDAEARASLVRPFDGQWRSR